MLRVKPQQLRRPVLNNTVPKSVAVSFCIRAFAARTARLSSAQQIQCGTLRSFPLGGEKNHVQRQSSVSFAGLRSCLRKLSHLSVRCGLTPHTRRVPTRRKPQGELLAKADVQTLILTFGCPGTQKAASNVWLLAVRQFSRARRQHAWNLLPEWLDQHQSGHQRFFFEPVDTAG